MLREISEEVRINLKDRLREMRHAIRRHRHDTGNASVLPPPPGGRTPFPLPEIDGLVSRAVSVFDDAMTMAETLVPHDGRGHSKPMPFDTYFRPADNLLDGERAFRRDMYYLAKAMLARRNVVVEPVQEAGFAAVHAAMLRQHGHLFQPLKPDAGETERTARAAALCAALLVELLRARPVRPRLPQGRVAPQGRVEGVLEAETILAVSVLAPMALAVALASSGTDAESGSDLLDIAALAVEARLDRIMPACRAADPAAELTPIFAMLIFHLR
jgi:hypothetical protein